MILKFNDLIKESRYVSDEKFDWIVNNLGDWLFDEFFNSPSKILKLNFYEKFKSYLFAAKKNKHF